MFTVKDWQAELDSAEQIDSLRLVLSELNEAIVAREDSPYGEEVSVRDDLRSLELLREYGERKLGRLLD
ncbi:MAG: hypothetical protein JNL34_10590 [Anaerolineae bacterium]|nr:hypothetical protein [Anaerolineae bacterium]